MRLLGGAEINWRRSRGGDSNGSFSFAFLLILLTPQVEIPDADCIEEITIKLPADTCTLGKGEQEPLFVRSASFPLGEMFFVTEEPHPLSVAVDKVWDRTVFTRRYRVPFAQCCCGHATAHGPIHCDP